eukprot:2758163-Pyramimonas_sp.AAC.1
MLATSVDLARLRVWHHLTGPQPELASVGILGIHLVRLPWPPIFAARPGARVPGGGGEVGCRFSLHARVPGGCPGVPMPGGAPVP